MPPRTTYLCGKSGILGASSSLGSGGPAHPDNDKWCASSRSKLPSYPDLKQQVLGLIADTLKQTAGKAHWS